MVRNIQAIAPAVLDHGISRGYLPTGAAGTGSVGAAVQAAASVYSVYRQAAAEMESMGRIYGDFDRLFKDLLPQSLATGLPLENLLEIEVKAVTQGRSTAGGKLVRLRQGIDQLQHHQASSGALA